MVSLAEMIDRGYTVPTNPSEEKLQLYRRAAELGNAAARRAYQERILQLEQQRRMMQIMGTVIQNIPRR
jgi:hypothetical protein